MPKEVLYILCVVFIALAWYVILKANYRDLAEIYERERQGTKATRELNEEEKKRVVELVKANFPDEVNEKILSETIKVRSKQLEE